MAGGGAFVEGGYNGTIAPDLGSPIAGRAAWTGSSGSRIMHDPQKSRSIWARFAGQAVRVRWRLAADPLALGSLPGLGWWIDDVAFVDLVEHCPFPPIAQDDFAATLRDTPVRIAVLANDSDPDGDPLTVTGVTDPAHGSAADNGDGTVTYTPDPGFVGGDSFEYSISDGAGGADSATVSVTVEESHTLAGKVTGNGWFPATGGGKASFHFNADGEQPAPQGRISYDASDAGGAKLKGTVTEVELASATAASLRGPCELADGSACSFEATVEDNGEPGSGDRFEIRVFDAGGNPIHAAGGGLGGGNIQIR